MQWLPCVALILLSLVVQAEPVKLANGEWPPYQSQQLKHGGYISQFTKEAFAAAGYEVEYAYLPWKRGYEEAKAGIFDGSIIWSKNAERAKDFWFSDPIFELSTSLFQRIDMEYDIQSVDDLVGLELGGMIGYIYGTEELENAGLIEIQRNTSTQANFKKLMLGRLDIALESTDVGHELVQQMGISDRVKAHPTTINHRDYYLIISKNSPRAQELLDAFNRGMDKLKAQGKLKAYREASARGEYKM
jgi:polar amino acid transport system substrate-binding protein